MLGLELWNLNPSMSYKILCALYEVNFFLLPCKHCHCFIINLTRTWDDVNATECAWPLSQTALQSIWEVKWWWDGKVRWYWFLHKVLQTKNSHPSKISFGIFALKTCTGHILASVWRSDINAHLSQTSSILTSYIGVRKTYQYLATALSLSSAMVCQVEAGSTTRAVAFHDSSLRRQSFQT